MSPDAFPISLPLFFQGCRKNFRTSNAQVLSRLFTLSNQHSEVFFSTFALPPAITSLAPQNIFFRTTYQHSRASIVHKKFVAFAGATS
jgi:hypothetical protein